MSRQDHGNPSKFILGFALLFVGAALAGPMIFFGIGFLYNETEGGGSLLTTIALGSAVALWFFGVLWAANMLTGQKRSKNVVEKQGEVTNGR